MNFPGQKQKVEGVVCGNCSHAIIQDPDSGKWFHQNRDTKDACTFLSKDIVCKCAQANPFSKPLPRPPVQEPRRVLQEEESQPQRVVAEETVSLPKPVENPIQRVLDYLLVEREFSVSDSNLILDLAKKDLLASVTRKEESE